MLLLNASLERSEQPPLEQRGDVMNARHDFVSLFIPAADDRNAMIVTRGREAGIAFPSVRVDCCARLYGLSNEVQQAFGGDIVDAPQADAPDSTAVFLRRDHDDGLFLDLATPLALFNASNAGFAGLDLASKRRSRSGRTIALRSLCIHVQAVSKLPRPNTRGKPRAPAPFF